MNIIVLVAPTVEPVTLAEVWEHLRLTPTDSPPSHPHDTTLARHIKSARGDVERMTHRALVQQQLLLTTDRFPLRGYIELLRPPISEVLSVSYYDENNALQTIASSNYFVTDDFVSRLQFIDGYTTPNVYAANDAVRIEYIAGYPPADSPPTDYTGNIPAEIKNAILLGVELLYNPLKPDERAAIENARDSLMAGYTVPRM